MNAAYSATVKLQLKEIDYAANMVLWLMSKAASLGLGPYDLLGKTFDLLKAYEQLAILPAHQKHSDVGFPVGGSSRFF